MTSASSQPHQPVADYPDRISRQAFEQLVSVRGEGDEWDFKATLNDLSSTSVRVNLAKDALAFCNLPTGGTLIVGVTDDYDHVGLAATEKIDTTAIRQAIEKYIDGDFIVVAAEHTLVESGSAEEKRYGMIHFRRRFAQPVLAALDGQIRNDKPPLFRSGDILIRRGAASIRANSGDVRRLFTNSIVHEERVRAVNELWSCLVEQRHLMGGVEFLYDILADSEYPEAITKPDLRAALGNLTTGQHAADADRLQLRCETSSGSSARRRRDLVSERFTDRPRWWCRVSEPFSNPSRSDLSPCRCFDRLSGSADVHVIPVSPQVAGLGAACVIPTAPS